MKLLFFLFVMALAIVSSCVAEETEIIKDKDLILKIGKDKILQFIKKFFMKYDF